MRSVLSWALMGALVGTGVCATVSDVRTGLISNHLLGAVALCGGIIDAILYGIFATQDIVVFAVNAVTTICASIVLFYAHIWAGGDTKLACTCAVLFPASMYVDWLGARFTLFVAILGSFLVGYAYLSVDFVRSALLKKIKLSWRLLVKNLMSFALSYLHILICVIPVNYAIGMVSAQFGSIPEILWIAIDMAVAWCISRIQFLRRLGMAISILVLDVFITVWQRQVLVSTNIWFYLAIFLVALSRIALMQGIYEKIPTETVKPRMILATVDTIELQKSRVKGLPGISTEDLRSRLTSDEATSVRRWGKTARGNEYITIVRKIPLAGSIVISFIIYAVVGMMQ